VKCILDVLARRMVASVLLIEALAWVDVSLSRCRQRQIDSRQEVMHDNILQTQSGASGFV
jgi:hypothetical protein